jgi:lipopolysaccharide transport system permease protein
MGLLWSVIQPIVMLALYTYVFSTIMRVKVGGTEGIGDFAIYLFCGLLPWNGFASALNRATGIIRENANLVKRSLMPSEVLPIYPVISGIFDQLLGLGILFLALAISAHPISPIILLLPVILLFQFILTVGLAWIIAGITVFVRDLGQIIGVGLTVWSFLTPIFYPPDLIPEGFRFAMAFNPIYGLVESYRSLILKGQFPPWGLFGFLAGCALVTFLLSYRMFMRMQRAFADVI